MSQWVWQNLTVYSKLFFDLAGNWREVITLVADYKNKIESWIKNLIMWSKNAKMYFLTYVTDCRSQFRTLQFKLSLISFPIRTAQNIRCPNMLTKLPYHVQLKLNQAKTGLFWILKFNNSGNHYEKTRCRPDSRQSCILHCSLSFRVHLSKKNTH